MAIKINSINDSHYSRKLTKQEGAKLYTKLRSAILKAGILDRAYWYYSTISLIDIGGLFISIAFLYFVRQWALIILLSILIGFFVVRVGGLLHDAGHRSIFKSTLLNDIYGYILSFLIAFPFHAWKIKHNAHHAHTNEEGGDPDLDIPFQFLEEVPKQRTGFERWVHQNQLLLYYPIGSFVAFATRNSAFNRFGKSRNTKFYILVLVQMIALFFWYVAPFIFFPMYKALLFFIVNNFFIGFYLLNIFAPNHKGMPQVKKGVEFSFFEQQIITSRNITPNWLVDYLFLGLNYQIEHHLFVNCPRNKLSRVGTYVRKICKLHKIPFMEMGVFESNKFILSQLKTAQAFAR